MSNNAQIVSNGLWGNNVALVQLLGLCPLLAVTSTVINGFGVLSVSGRMRVPSPAARIIAFCPGALMLRASLQTVAFRAEDKHRTRPLRQQGQGAEGSFPGRRRRVTDA